MSTNTIDQWWQTTGLNLSHKDACTEAFKLGMSEANETMKMALVVLEDHNLAPFIQQKLRTLTGVFSPASVHYVPAQAVAP